MDEEHLSTAREKKKASREELIYEYAEVILVSILWMLVLRSFAFEFYRIPTGSMAPHLLGVHRLAECPRCEFEFEVGAPTTPQGAYNPENDRRSAECPNCRHSFSTESVKIRPGNRILVNKFIYGFQDANLWDIIVFRNPKNPEINFIKRCIARSGDTLDIQNGDIYLNGEVSRKPWSLQRGAWIPVYDSSFDPAPDVWSAWKTEGWELAANQYRSPADGYRVMKYKYDVEDRYGYEDPNAPAAGSNLDVVGDFVLECDWQSDGDGIVEFVIGENKNIFTLRIETVNGKHNAILIRNGDLDERAVVQSADAIELAAGWNRLYFTNVDCQVRVMVNGEALFEDYLYEEEQLDDEYESTTVEIRSENLAVEVQNIRIQRDIHYLVGGMSNFRALQASMEEYNAQGKKFYVGFGDHTTNSSDSRFFGVIPAENMVGRAIVIVWPMHPRFPWLNIRLIR